MNFDKMETELTPNPISFKEIFLLVIECLFPSTNQRDCSALTLSFRSSHFAAKSYSRICSLPDFIEFGIRGVGSIDSPFDDDKIECLL